VRVAVTFCNQHSTPRLAVCAVDLDTDERAWLDVPPEFDRGAAGIADIDGDILVACQPGGLFRYGADLRPSTMLPTPNARNLHSILHRPGERAVYVTSAHNDTLFRYGLDETGTRVLDTKEVYCADPRRRGDDLYHLNSVAEWDGDLYVTMFGTKDGATNRDRRNGCVVRVADGEVVAAGLYHPHSLYALGDSLLVVESQARAVRRVAGGPSAAWTIDGGYPRGIVATGPQTIWVGVSSLRRESSSLGTQNVINSSSPLDFRTRLVEIDLASGELGRTVDLTDLGAEIFEVRPLPAGAAFAPSPERGLSERIDALETSYREMRGALRSGNHTSRRTARDQLKRLVRRVR
jgi:uncharacterized protein DUF4915